MATPFESETTEVTNNADDINMKSQKNQHPLGDESKQEQPISEKDSTADDLKNVETSWQKSESTELNDYEKLATELHHHKTPEVTDNAEDMKMNKQDNEHSLGDESEQEEQTNDAISAEEDPEKVEEESQKTKTKGPTGYDKIPKEIRLHILSFTDLKSLREYRQCSKQCNEEFLEFQLPFRIELLDVDGCIEVNLAYTAPNRAKSKPFTKIEDAQKYFTEMYRYFAEDLDQVVINMKKWPAEIVKMQPFASAIFWHVTIRKSMYDEFIEFARTKELANRINHNMHWSLHLNECDKMEDRVIVGREFFQSGILRSLWNLDISTKSQMDLNDLLNCNQTELRLKSWTDLEILRQGVECFNVINKITIDLLPDDASTFKMAELFPRGRFHVRYLQHYCKFKIGTHIQGKIMRNGKYLRLKGFIGNPNIYKSDSEETDEEAYGEEDCRSDTEYPYDDEPWGVSYAEAFGESAQNEDSEESKTSDEEEEIDNYVEDEARYSDDEESDDGNDGDDESGEQYGN